MFVVFIAGGDEARAKNRTGPRDLPDFEPRRNFLVPDRGHFKRRVFEEIDRLKYVSDIKVI